MTKSNGPVHTVEQIKLLLQSQQPLVLAQHVYDTGTIAAPPGWKIVATSTNEWHGGFFARIYEKQGPLRAGEQRYVAAFRGTNKMTDLRNLDADFQIVSRKLPSQHYQGVDFIMTFCAQNNIKADEIALTGHSLGGYLATTIGMELGIGRMWAFNAPGPTRDLRDELSHKIPGISKTPCNSLVQIRSTHDVISRWQYAEGRIIEVTTPGTTHSLGNLQKGVEAVVTGQPLPPEPFVKKTLSTIFNDISKRLSESPVADIIIDTLFRGKDGSRRPKDCVCAHA